MFRKKAILILIGLVGFSSCSYYQRKHQELQTYVTQGEVEKAYGVISHQEKKWDRGKDKLLYYLNRGTLAWMLNKTEESTEYFLKADDFLDWHQAHYGREALAMATNQKTTLYQGEEFEKLLFHYYLAVNYLNQNNYEDALVQCRRMNLQLNRLDNKFQNEKDGGTANKYQRDAFIHTLMGIIYDAAGEYNDAYVAYKNALDVYQNDYTENFGIGPPEQLEKDLLLAAYRTGLDDEVRRYEMLLNRKLEIPDPNHGSLLFLWNNGLGPVKTENSITFEIIRGEIGWVTAVNDEFGFSFPIYIGAENTNDTSLFSKLEYIRVAYPSYRYRMPLFTSAHLHSQNKIQGFELLQDVDKIARKSLDDRMNKVMLKMVTRLVLKKVSEYALRSEDQTAGALLGIVNAVSEQADTRNWQTLPQSIHYTRMSLPPGNQKVSLKASGRNFSDAFDFTFNIRKGRTYIHSFQTLETVVYR